MNIKKAFCILTSALILAGALSGCGNGPEHEKIRVAVINGPSGIGMAQLLDMPEKYDVSVYQSPDEVAGKVVSGEVDIAAVPVNMGAVLYNRTEGQVVAVSPLTKGMLFIVQNGGEKITAIDDLTGKEILAAAKGSTLEFILQKLFTEHGLSSAMENVSWMANHADVSSTLLSGENTIAMLPEPFVTVVKNKGANVEIALDLNDEWLKATGGALTMTVLIAQRKFAEEKPDDLAAFLSDYKASVDFVNSGTEEAAALVSEKGFIADLDTAKDAIPRCNIVFYEDPEESKTILSDFYSVLFEIDPKSVGGALPDEEFYYSQ